MLSGAVTQSVSDVFSTTYDNYRILIDYTGSTSLTLTARLRVSGADNSTSNYHRQFLNANNTSVAGARSASQTSWTIGGIDANTSRSAVQIDLMNPFLSVVTGASVIQSENYNSSVAVSVTYFTIGFGATTSFTGFSLIPNTGNITGSVSVYGYSK